MTSRGRHVALWTAVLVSAAVSLYLHWPAPAADEVAIAAREIGVRSDRSIIAVEPFLTPQAYRSPASLRATLRPYLERARSNGWIAPTTIIVFPEHIGTWLAVADSPALAYRARTLRTAMAAVFIDDPMRILKEFKAAREEGRLAAAIFRARSRRMAADYQYVFGTLAREYGVTVVAGSIALQDPRVEEGKILTGHGPIYNISAVFGPDGEPNPTLVVKRHPIPSESVFLRGGEVETPSFETAAGRLGVLICADSWHPEEYAAVRDADVIVVPAFLQANGAWSTPWRGYVTGEPDDIDTADIGEISEGDAWSKYAMPGRIGDTRAHTGVTAFLHGDLWDLGADGRTLAYARGRNVVGEAPVVGSVSVIWR